LEVPSTDGGVRNFFLKLKSSVTIYSGFNFGALLWITKAYRRICKKEKIIVKLQVHGIYNRKYNTFIYLFIYLFVYVRD
jgi:hypothetical protein